MPLDALCYRKFFVWLTALFGIPRVVLDKYAIRIPYYYLAVIILFMDVFYISADTSTVIGSGTPETRAI